MSFKSIFNECLARAKEHFTAKPVETTEAFTPVAVGMTWYWRFRAKDLGFRVRFRAKNLGSRVLGFRVEGLRA